MPATKGTKEYDLSQDAWTFINGYRCYAVHKVRFSPVHSITYPEKYHHYLPVLVIIEQEYEKGQKKGERLYPETYVLRKHMLLNKKVQKVQSKKCPGRIVPITELEIYSGQELR